MNGVWTTVEIAGKPADLYEPVSVPRSRFGVLYLHDTRGESLRDRPTFTRLFDELGLACVCPLAPRTWWTDRRCPEFDSIMTAERLVLDHVLPTYRRRWNLGPRGVGLLGVGMGGQGALRLAFKHAEHFPVLAALAPSLDYHEYYGAGSEIDALYDSKEQCRQDTAIMHVPPHNYPPHIFFGSDPDDAYWHRGNDRLHEKMTALGIPHECDLTTRAGGHTWQYYEHMAERAVRFLHAGLDQESRRLI
jgi:S-formylglutathione hydrolase FrmB